jgi:hypothetical protein
LAQELQAERSTIGQMAPVSPTKAATPCAHPSQLRNAELELEDNPVMKRPQHPARAGPRTGCSTKCDTRRDYPDRCPCRLPTSGTKHGNCLTSGKAASARASSECRRAARSTASADAFRNLLENAPGQQGPVKIELIAARADSRCRAGHGRVLRAASSDRPGWRIVRDNAQA